MCGFGSAELGLRVRGTLWGSAGAVLLIPVCSRNTKANTSINHGPGAAAADRQQRESSEDCAPAAAHPASRGAVVPVSILALFLQTCSSIRGGEESQGQNAGAGEQEVGLLFPKHRDAMTSWLRQAEAPRVVVCT